MLGQRQKEREGKIPGHSRVLAPKLKSTKYKALNLKATKLPDRLARANSLFFPPGGKRPGWGLDPQQNSGQKGPKIWGTRRARESITFPLLGRGRVNPSREMGLRL